MRIVAASTHQQQSQAKSDAKGNYRLELAGITKPTRIMIDAVKRIGSVSRRTDMHRALSDDEVVGRLRRPCPQHRLLPDKKVDPPDAWLCSNALGVALRVLAIETSRYSEPVYEKRPSPGTLARSR
jgi:hypothetical protein